MKVIDAIIKLQQLDPNMTILLDVTPQGSKMFHFAELAEIEEVEQEEDQSAFVAMFPGFQDKQGSQN